MVGRGRWRDRRGGQCCKRRRRCIRAVRVADTVYAVAIKGSARTGWVRNALAGPSVKLRLPDGVHDGRARAVTSDEREGARELYVRSVGHFDYLTFVNWRPGRPTSEKIEMLLGDWFDSGYPIAIDLL